MKIVIRNRMGDGRTYVITEKDRKFDYIDIQGLIIEEYYDYDSGEPINEQIREMDNCIYKEEWDPYRFVELWRQNIDSDYIAEVIN